LERSCGYIAPRVTPQAGKTACGRLVTILRNRTHAAATAEGAQACGYRIGDADRGR
jgi:hypothetical protein